MSRLSILKGNLDPSASFPYKSKKKEVLEHFKHVIKICPNRGYIFFIINYGILGQQYKKISDIKYKISLMAVCWYV